MSLGLPTDEGIYVSDSQFLRRFDSAGAITGQTAASCNLGGATIVSGGITLIGTTDDTLLALTSSFGMLWQFASPGTFGTASVGQDGTLYVGSDSGTVYGLPPADAATARAPAELWAYRTGGTVFGQPAIDVNGTAYVGSGDGSVYAIRRDGSLAWRIDTGAPVFSSPAIGADGTVYVGNSAGHLIAIGEK